MSKIAVFPYTSLEVNHLEFPDKPGLANLESSALGLSSSEVVMFVLIQYTIPA